VTYGTRAQWVQSNLDIFFVILFIIVWGAGWGVDGGLPPVVLLCLMKLLISGETSPERASRDKSNSTRFK